MDVLNGVLWNPELEKISKESWDNPGNETGTIIKRYGYSKLVEIEQLRLQFHRYLRFLSRFSNCFVTDTGNYTSLNIRIRSPPNQCCFYIRRCPVATC